MGEEGKLMKGKLERRKGGETTRVKRRGTDREERKDKGGGRHGKKG